MPAGFLYDLATHGANFSSDAATVPQMPVMNLTEPQPRRRARLMGGAASLIVDFGAEKSIDCAGLISTTLTESATIRARVGSAEALVEAAPLVALNFTGPTPSSMAEWPAPRGAGGGLGEATYFDAQGVRRIAAAGEWRIDHDPITRARRGLLLEPTKTNFVRQIVRNGNAVGPWSQGGGGTATATVTPNFSLAVDGNQTAARVRWVGPNAGTVSLRVPISGVPVSTTCTVSFYAFTRSLGNATSATVDLLDGTASASILSQFILNQMVRVVAAGVVSGTNAASQWVDVNFLGFTTGEIDIDIEGIQVEEGAFATSLMLAAPGGVGPVARQQDTGSIAVTALASATLYLEERTVAQAASGSLGGAWADDGTANNRVAATAEGGVGYAPTVTGTGINIATFSTTAIANGVVDRLAVSYEPNAMAAALNGVSLGTDASGTLSANISRVALPAGDRVRHLRALRLYAGRLTNAQLVALSGTGSSLTATGTTADSGTVNAEAQGAAQGNVILTFPAPAVGRILRIDIADVTNFTDVGLCIAGALWRTTRSFAYGIEEGREILDRRDRNSFTGAEFPVPAIINPRFARFTLPVISDAEVRDNHRDLVRLLGAAKDGLVIPDLADGLAERNRRAIYGALNLPGGGAGTIMRAYSISERSFSITERV